MVLVGIDFGTDTSVATVLNGDALSIVPNELSNSTTPTTVGTTAEGRVVGEAASTQAISNAVNTLAELTLLTGLDGAGLRSALDRLPQARWVPAVRAGRGAAKLSLRGDDATLLIEQLIAMLFSRLRLQAKKLAGASADADSAVVSVPATFSERACASVLDALRIAGFASAAVVPAHEAILAWHAKLVNTSGQNAGNPVLIVDVGHAFTTAIVVEAGQTTPKSANTIQLGARQIDSHLWNWAAQEIWKKHKVTVQAGTKVGSRLLQACVRAKKVLSTVTDTFLELENVAEDVDAKLPLSRAAFEEMCAAERAELAELLSSVIASSGLSPQTAELIGGGSRVPFVKDVIAAAVGGAERLRYGLDSTHTLALGAGHLATQRPSQDTVGFDAELLAECVKFEAELMVLDAAAEELAESRNQFEGWMYETRQQAHGKNAALLPIAKVGPVLERAEAWLYDAEGGETASVSEFQLQLLKFKKEIDTLCPEYAKKIEEERVKLEEQLSESAKEVDPDDKDDHDNRKLKKSDRMRLVVKNKEEGNELLKGTNYESACRRYVKALSHCEKFFDLSPADEEEVKALRLSLYLNISQCHVKLENWHKVVENCRYALEISPDNQKALYRRALGYFSLGKIDEAHKDLKKATAIDPKEPAVKSLLGKVEKQIELQKKKEKEVYGKMFK